jgi:hypothetical protein
MERRQGRTTPEGWTGEFFPVKLNPKLVKPSRPLAEPVKPVSRER